MKHKIIVWIFAMVLLSSIAHAALSDGLISYWSHDNSNVSGATSYDNVGPNDGTITNALTNQSGKIGESFYFDGTGDWVEVSNDASIQLAGKNRTLMAWVNITGGAGAWRGIISKRLVGGAHTVEYSMGLAGTVVPNALFSAGSGNVYSATAPSQNVWHFVVVTVNGTNHSVYIDGVLSNTTTQAEASSGTNTLRIGSSAEIEPFTGFIDEVAIYDRPISQSEITLLYNSGSGCSYSQINAGTCGTSTTTDLYITAKDSWNSSSISSFNVNISWSNGTTTSHASSGGNVYLSNLSNGGTTYNITFWNVTDYFNSVNTSVTLVNSTNNTLVAYLHQAEVCFNATARISNASVTPNNFTIGSTTRTSCFNLSAGTHNVMANKTGWNSQNQTFTVTALQNNTQIVQNMTYANLTIFVKDNHTGAYLSTYDIYLTSENYTSWNGENYTGVTNKTYLLINGTYNVTVFKTGYAVTNANKDVTVAGHTNYTFYLREANTLNITIYNESNNSIMGTNVTIDLIQETQTWNYSTANGSLYVTGLEVGEIEIRYDDPGSVYRGRTYFVTLSNYTYQEVRLYLLDTALGSLITFDLVDQDGQDLENATVKAQRFYPADNMYRTVAMTKSNFNGEGSIDLVKKSTQANVFYKFIVEYDGEVKQETTATEINPLAADVLYFTVDVLEDIFTSWDGMESVQYNLTNGTWGDGTPYFKFIWSDTTGLTQYGCLKVTEHTPLTESMKCNNCTVSTSATIYCNLTDNGHLYKAAAIIETTTNHSWYTVESDSWSFDDKSATFGTFGVFIAFIFIGTMAGIGLWNPIVAVVLTLVGLVFAVILGMVNMAYVTVVSLIIVGGIIIAKSRT